MHRILIFPLRMSVPSEYVIIWVELLVKECCGIFYRARDELDEVDVVTISETPKRSSERGLSQPPRKKIPKINRKLSIQRYR